MRVLIRLLVVAGVVVSVFLILARPIYLAYACGGVVIVLGCRYLFNRLRRIFTPWPGFASIMTDIFAGFGLVFGPLVTISLGAGFGPYGLLAAGIVIVSFAVWLFRRVGKKAEFQRVLFLTSIPIAIALLSILFIRRYGAPRSTHVLYTGTASFKDQRWIVKHELTFEKEADPELLDLQAERQPPSGSMAQCGWKEEIEGTFSKVGDQPIISRWIPLRTVNTFVFPPLTVLCNLRIRTPSKPCCSWARFLRVLPMFCSPT